MIKYLTWRIEKAVKGGKDIKSITITNSEYHRLKDQLSEVCESKTFYGVKLCIVDNHVQIVPDEKSNLLKRTDGKNKQQDNNHDRS